jgi:hypothetical protein
MLFSENPVSLPLRQATYLSNVFIFMIQLSEGRADEDLEPPKNAMPLLPRNEVYLTSRQDFLFASVLLLSLSLSIPYFSFNFGNLV